VRCGDVGGGEDDYRCYEADYSNAVDWTEVNYVKIAVKHSSEQAYYFLVDELCFIE
jgi:hypothetical protein